MPACLCLALQRTYLLRTYRGSTKIGSSPVTAVLGAATIRTILEERNGTMDDRCLLSISTQIGNYLGALLTQCSAPCIALTTLPLTTYQHHRNRRWPRSHPPLTSSGRDLRRVRSYGLTSLLLPPRPAVTPMTAAFGNIPVLSPGSPPSAK